MNLDVPPPFPDEYVSGHVSRIVRINQFANYAHLRRHLFASEDRQAPSAARFKNAWELFEQKLEGSVGRYGKAHSLEALLDLLATKKLDNVGSDARNRVTKPLFFFPESRAAERPWKLCQLCRKEDIENFDVAYWHRSHQIPGRESCPRHGIPLMHLPNNAIHQIPNPDVVLGDLSSPSVLRGESSSIIQRYLRVCTQVLRSPQRCPDRTHVWLALREFGGPRRTRRYELGAQGSLARLVTPHLPKHWVKKHFPQNFDFSGVNYRGWTDGLLLLYLCALAPTFEAVWDVLSNKKRVQISVAEVANASDALET